jgi:carbon storage regulator
MLILTRKTGTSIRIGPDIVIHVIQGGRSHVKLGIDAPKEVRILRGELPEFSPACDQEDSHLEALLLQH